MNAFASLDILSNEVSPAQSGKRTSNFVIEICVAPLSMIARLAKSKSKSAARL